METKDNKKEVKTKQTLAFVAIASAIAGVVAGWWITSTIKDQKIAFYEAELETIGEMINLQKED